MLLPAAVVKFFAAATMHAVLTCVCTVMLSTLLIDGHSTFNSVKEGAIKFNLQFINQSG